MDYKIYLYKENETDLVGTLNQSEKLNCNGLIAYVVNPKFGTKDPKKHIRFTRSELLLDSSKWENQIISKLSNSIDCDSPNEDIRLHSESVLKQELAYAQHVSVRGDIMIELHGTKTSNLARLISSELTGIKNHIFDMNYLSYVEQNLRN